MTSDAELLRLAEHDAGAFRSLYDRHASAIHGSLRRRGVDHHTALDLTAETFATAWQCRDRFSDPGTGNAGPWLQGIARNVLSHAARHRAVSTRARERLGMLVDRRSFDASAIDAVDELDGFDPDLEAALDALDDRSRRAVDLRVLNDKSYDEISDDIGGSPLAARIRVSRALGQLRTDLNKNKEKAGDEQ